MLGGLSVVSWYPVSAGGSLGGPGHPRLLVYIRGAMLDGIGVDRSTGGLQSWRALALPFPSSLLYIINTLHSNNNKQKVSPDTAGAVGEGP